MAAIGSYSFLLVRLGGRAGTRPRAASRSAGDRLCISTIGLLQEPFCAISYQDESDPVQNGASSAQMVGDRSRASRRRWLRNRGSFRVRQGRRTGERREAAGCAGRRGYWLHEWEWSRCSLVSAEGLNMRSAMIAAVSAALASCSQLQHGTCGAPPPMLQLNASDRGMQIMVADSCVAHWSARLAPVRSSIGELADATLGACRAAIRRIGEHSPRDGIVEYSQEERERIYRQAAMFRIAQRRADACD